MTDADTTPAAEPANPSVAAAATLRWGRLCVIGAFVAILLAEATGVRWPFNLITPFTPQLTAIALLGVGLIAVVRWRFRRRNWQDRVWLAMGTAVALYAGAITLGLVPWRVAPAAKVATSDDPNIATIKVLSANVHTTNTLHNRVLKMIRQEQPDVILLMELNTRWVDALKELDATYPHRRVMPDETGNFGIGIWTKLPVHDAQLVLMTEGGSEAGKDAKSFNRYDVPQADMTVILADRATGEPHLVRFVGLHPLPPMNRAMSKARDAVLARTGKSLVETRAIPTIVAGDLNATRYCRMLRDLTRRGNLADATSPVRFSWPNKWSWWAMGIRIDHVLVSDDHWRVVDVKSGPDIGSDHMPLLATLQLVKGGTTPPASAPVD